ncbi:hypothetical protein D1007_27748 [Hordeum vulgare]|nr:hypothetical protein D1007_27748 [Hordeum vulgare]
MASTIAKPIDDIHSTGGGGTGDGGREYSEVDNWLGSGSFATEPAAVPPPQQTPSATPQDTPSLPQFSLEYRAARYFPRAVATDPANSHHWEEKEVDSEEERIVAKDRSEKLNHVRRSTVNPGPISRAQSQLENPKFQDFILEPDEYCFPGDVGISDSHGDVPRLPSRRKRRLKKKKERKWTLRNFQYHRNEPIRIIIWCPKRKNGCEFFMTASKVAHEDTFTIKKCHLDHSCGAAGESTKVNEDLIAEAMEDTVRSNVMADIARGNYETY